MKLFKPKGAKKWHIPLGSANWATALCGRCIYYFHEDQVGDTDNVADADICKTCKQANGDEAR